LNFYAFFSKISAAQSKKKESILCSEFHSLFKIILASQELLAVERSKDL
jgi:hypothetical protein